MNTFLKQLTETLQEQGAQTHLVAVDEAQSAFQLLVELEEDPPLRLSAFFLSDLLALSAGEESADIAGQMQASGSDFLQLFIQFPFSFEDYALPDLARLILMINWTTPLGAFGMNESQRIIYYRHIFEKVNEEPSLLLVSEAVNAMAFYARMRFESLQQVASAEVTLADYLQALDEAGQRAEEFPGYDL